MGTRDRRDLNELPLHDDVDELLAKSEREENAAELEGEEEPTGVHNVAELAPKREPMPSAPEIHNHIHVMTPPKSDRPRSDPKSLRESVKATKWPTIVAALGALAALITAIAKAAIELAQVMH
jgi:hypothetical protein